MKDEAAWRFQVGELMIRFAEIEASIAGCLIVLPKENRFEEFKADTFTKRCNAAIEAAQTAPVNPSIIQDIIATIHRAMKLAKMRNLIAHNPINLNLSSLFDDTEPRYEIRDYRKHKQAVELEELKKIVIAVNECNDKLHDALSRAEDEIWGLDD